MRIMFVCHGNICRSVLAEMLFKHYDINKEFIVSSCATSREEIGNPIYPPIKTELEKHNINIEPHVARQMTYLDYLNNDYIIAMDYQNIDNIKRIIGNDTENKIYLLKHFIGVEEEVFDPWYTREFAKCYQEIDTCVKKLYNFLKERK